MIFQKSGGPLVGQAPLQTFQIDVIYSFLKKRFFFSTGLPFRGFPFLKHSSSENTAFCKSGVKTRAPGAGNPPPVVLQDGNPSPRGPPRRSWIVLLVVFVRFWCRCCSLLGIFLFFYYFCIFFWIFHDRKSFIFIDPVEVFNVFVFSTCYFS